MVMKKRLLIAAIALAPLLTKSYASTTIGVVDVQKVLLTSATAKQYAKQSKASFQPKLDKLVAEHDAIQKAESELKKNSLTMSKTALSKKQEALEKEKQSFVERLQTLRKEKDQADEKELLRLEPKLKKAVASVAKKLKLSLVIEKSSVIYRAEETDVSSQVLNELNKESTAKK